LTPWWLAAAIWRASRLSAISVICGAASQLIAPETVSTQISPGRLTIRSVTSSRPSQAASGAR
jgi:hypothetical protein